MGPSGHPTVTPQAAVSDATAADAVGRLERAAADLRSAVDAAIAAQAAGLSSTGDAATILTDAVRLFAQYRAVGGQADPHPRELNPTQAVVAAAALLRSQDLSPFEFAIWFDAEAARSTEGS